MEFKLKRQPDTRPDEGFWYVHRADTDEVVGRIYDQTNVLPPRSVNIWYWTISLPYYRGSDEIWYGNVPTIEEAMAAFKKRWRLSNPE